MDKTFSRQMNELSSFMKGYTPLRVVKPTIECGQLEVLKQERIKEVLGLIGCSAIISFMFFGLILIL